MRRNAALAAIALALLVAAPLALYLSIPQSNSGLCDGEPIDGDTLFFIQEPGQQYASASLLCTPRSTPVLRSATRDIRYQAGGDFAWAPGTRRIALSAGSRIPFKTRSELYPALDAHNLSARSSTHPGKALLFAEGPFFHDLQVVASYETDEHWGLVSKGAPGFLPGTRARLRGHEPIALVVLGDSISTGANASGFVGARPYRPGYPGLVARGLEARGAAKVSLANLSVGGTTSAWGVSRIPAVVALAPNLLVIAFGMNDASGAPATTPKQYGQNIRRIVEATRKALPGCEIILVAPMIGNPDWAYLDDARLPAFRDELRRLAAPGVAVADVTSLWAEILKRKSFYDLTGNGLNHPNDFGHALYARAILDLLGP